MQTRAKILERPFRMVSTVIQILSEFYQFFWYLFGHLIVDSFNKSFEEGMLPASQRQAMINQIPKKDRDRLYLKNWRPISLLNQDYKIASKVIARRMQRVLPSVIHPDQCAYIKDRCIGEAVRILADVMHHTKETNSPCILLFCDFEKAFDSVDWSCLFKTFETFNFGPSLSRWVKTFYNKMKSCVMNGCTSSGYFNLGRGVRQGNPLSTYLFILHTSFLFFQVLPTGLFSNLFTTNARFSG